MRRTVLSSVRLGKQPSKESRASSKKLQATIDEFHAYLAGVNISHIGCDFEWLLEQEQILSRLNSKLVGQQRPNDQYKIKLRSCESLLHNIRQRVTRNKLNSVDVPMVSSTHHTSCEAKMRQKTVPVGFSVEKLKRTVPAKPSLRNTIDDKTPTSELVSDCERRSTALERQGTYQKFKHECLTNKLESLVDEDHAGLLFRNKELQDQLVRALQEQTRLQEFVRRLERELSETEGLKREISTQHELNKQLQSRISAISKEYSANSQQQSVKLQACLAASQKQAEALKVSNAKLSRQNQYLVGQSNRQTDTITNLNDRILELQKQLMQMDCNSSREVAMASNKHRQVQQKQAIIRQLIYEKQNYSDGYAQLRLEKTQHMNAIQQLEGKVAQLKRQLEESQSRNEEMQQNISELRNEKGKLEERFCQVNRQNQDMNSSIKDLRLELRDNRMELRKAEQKAQLFQERYYKLKQNSTDEEELVRTLTQKELSRSSKLITDRSRINCQHEKSTERQDQSQNRRVKALTDLKVLVKNHRLNITSGLR